MGLFRTYWGDMKWKNIFIAIVLGAIMIFAYTAASGNFQFSIQGLKISTIAASIRNFLLTGFGIVKKILVAAILVIPIIIQARLGIFEKTEATLWAVSAGMLLFLFGAESLSIEYSIYLAWGINIILLIYAAIKKEKPVESSVAWLIGGLTSLVIGPGGSLIRIVMTQRGELWSGWIIIAAAGAVITLVWKNFKEKTDERGSDFDKDEKDEEKDLDGEIKDTKLSIKNSEKEESIVLSADRVATLMENNLASGDATRIPASADNLSKYLSQAEGIASIQIKYRKPFAAAVENRRETQMKATHEVLDTVKDNNRYNYTKIGQAQAYLEYLAKKYLMEMKDPTSKWEDFEKLRLSSFKEVAEKLRETRNKKLAAFAKKLEKNAGRINIKLFITMIARTIKELNREREKAGHVVEQEFKNIEKSSREIKELTENVDAQFKAITDEKEKLSKYDEQSKKYYAEMREQLKQLVDIKTNFAEKRKLIGEIREKLRWIRDYLPKKKSVLTGMKGKINSIGELISKSREFIAKNGRAMGKIKEASIETGAKVEELNKAA